MSAAGEITLRLPHPIGMSRIRLTVSPGFVAALCVFAWADRTGLLLPFLVSALCHETAHLLALFLLRIPVQEISVSAGGTVISASLRQEPREAWAVLAGPAANLLLAGISGGFWPGLRLCAILQLGWNLLPVYPLDGGRLCRLLLPRIFGRAGTVLCNYLHAATLLAVICGGVYGTCILHLGLLPCIFSAIFLIRLPNGLDKCREYW